MDLIPHAVQVVRDEILCKNWIASIIWKDYKTVMAESNVVISGATRGKALFHPILGVIVMIGNGNHEKCTADNQPNLEILGVLVKFGKKAFHFEKTNSWTRLVHMLE
jgi:hypothetical protein